MKINKHQLIFYCEIHRGTANIPIRQRLKNYTILHCKGLKIRLPEYDVHLKEFKCSACTNDVRIAQ